MAPTSKSTKASQLRRNQRERNRVHQVNDGFDQLRDRVSKVTQNKKLSKADTLREAVKYIQYLKDLLKDDYSFQQNEYMVPAPMSAYPSPPSSFYDETSYYASTPNVSLPQLQMTPPQQPSPPQEYYPNHYPMQHYTNVMRPSP